MRDHKSYLLARQVEDAVERMYRAVDNLPDHDQDELLHPEMDRTVRRIFDLYGVKYVSCGACHNSTALICATFDRRSETWVGRCCALPPPKQLDKRVRRRHRRNR